MQLMFITNNIDVALEAESAGVDRIFIDLEIMGKVQRQGHLNTYISDHSMEDVRLIGQVLTKSELLVRINPLYNGTGAEVEQCVEYGADIIMLPMFKTKSEVAKFINTVNKRAKVCLLLETSQALLRIDEILEVEGIDEIHIGLNDLHLSLGLDFMFELLSEGMVSYLANKVKAKKIKFGFGGIAKIGEGDIKAEWILGEHFRLGSEMVILSRSFRNDIANNNEKNDSKQLKKEIDKIRKWESNIAAWNKDQFETNRKLVQQKVREIVNKTNK